MGSMRLLVPAYRYPVPGEGFWEALADASRSLGKERLLVIVNPNSGPGSGVDPSYSWAIDLLNEAGAVLFGYVHTSYGKRPLHQVLQDVRLWRSLYPRVRHFFLDEMSSEGSSEALAYYAELARSIRTLNDDHTERAAAAGGVDVRLIGNPGTAADDRLVHAAQLWMVVLHEDSAELPAAPTPLSRSRLPWGDIGRAMLLHSVRDGPDAVARAVRTARDHGIDSIYVTDRTLPNPWDALPRFWAQLVRACQS